MKTILNTSICLFIYLVVVPGSFAQSPLDTVAMRHDVQFALFSPEKVYLQTDRDVYNAGDTIWFKGYLQNKSYVSDYPESNFIYVEMSGVPRRTMGNNLEYREEQTLLFRAKIKRDHDGFSGYIPTKEEWITDRYFVRAYSHWMLNQDPEYVFHKELGIINVVKDVVKEQLDRSGNATQLAYDLQGLSIPVRERKGGKYDYDIQFLPESGQFLAGYPAVVGIKAVNNHGEGIPVSGGIYDSEHRLLASFQTNEIGLGAVTLSALAPNEVVTAEVTDAEGHPKTVRLPDIHRSGAAIQYQKLKDKLSVNIFVSEDLNPDDLSVLFHNGSEVTFCQQLMHKTTRLMLPDEKLTPGIHTITVTSNKYNVLAQRVFFVFGQETVNTALSYDKKGIQKRSEVDLSIKLTDHNGESVKGDFSVSVTDRIAAQNPQVDNIVSYMLLSSELTGYIEDPQRYFCDTIPYQTRLSEIDYLMLTQGWRYYEPQRIAKGDYAMPIFGREYNQSMAGKVIGLFKTPQKSMISVISRSINFSALGEVNEGGKFVLENVSFPEGTNFLVTAYNKNGKARFVSPILDNEPYAPLIQYHSKPTKIQYDQTYRQETLLSKSLTGVDVRELAPAVVTAQRITLRNNPSPIQNMTFRRDQVRMEEDMKEYGEMDLMTYIARTFQGIRIKYVSVGIQGTDDTTNVQWASPGSLNNLETTTEKSVPMKEPESSVSFPPEAAPEGRLLVSVGTSSSVSSRMSMTRTSEFPVLVYINKVPVSQDELEYYTVADVETIIYVTDYNADIIRPALGAGGERSGGGVLFIALKKRTRQANILLSSPLGWQKKAKFYTPKYQKDNPSLPSQRYTLHWEPYLKSDEDGNLNLKFFSSDRTGGYRVVVEGITEKGAYYSYTGWI